MKGSIKLCRREIELWKKLTDQEVRIYLLLRMRAGWDKRHVDNYGKAKNTLRDLRKYLPEKGSSIGKLSAVLKSLDEKGFIKRISDGEIRVENFDVFQLPLQGVERCLQYLEQGLQPPEQLVRDLEKDPRRLIADKSRDLAEKFRFSSSDTFRKSNTFSRKETKEK